jgi:hypothetical protein
VAPLNVIDWKNNSAIKLPLCYKERNVDNDELSLLFKVYSTMFPGNNIVIEQLSRTMNRYSTIEIFNQQFGSRFNVTQNTMLFGMIEFYFTHSLKVGEEFMIFYFACVTWHQTVDDTNFNLNPLCVASMKDKLPLGSSRFLPVQRISTKCAIAIEENEHNDKRYILSP